MRSRPTSARASALVAFALCLCGLAGGGGAPPAAASEAIGLTGAGQPSYDLDLTWTPTGPGTGRLRGTERLGFRNTGSKPLRSIWLRTWANGPDRCDPRRIRVRVSGGGRPGRRGCTALEVRLRRPVAPGGRASVALGLSIRSRGGFDRFGRSRRVALLGEVVPLLAVTDRSGVHRHEPYNGLGESFYALAGPWRAKLRAPAPLRIASTGATASERVAHGRRTVTVTTPHARSFGLAIGRMRLLTRTVEGVRVRVFGDRTSSRRKLLRETARALPLFQSRFGPYGSPEYDVVATRGGRGFGQEYPELVMAGPERGTAAHELGHQWWYGIVGNDQYREPWLDESLASYSDGLSASGFRYCPDLRRLTRPSLRLDRPMRYWLPRSPSYTAIVYGYGACTFRRLERRIGTPAMTHFLRTLVAENRYGVITASDLASALARSAPGFDGRGFLRRARAIR